MSDSHQTSRRTVLGLGITASIGVTCGGCASWFRRTPRFAITPRDGKLSFELAKAPELVAGDRNMIVRNAETLERILVFRTGEGEIEATSVECPHKGWDIDFNHTSRQIECPAHGSRFLPDGSLHKGPATEDLKHYDAEIVGQMVHISVG